MGQCARGETPHRTEIAAPSLREWLAMTKSARGEWLAMTLGILRGVCSRPLRDGDREDRRRFRAYGNTPLRDGDVASRSGHPPQADDTEELLI